MYYDTQLALEARGTPNTTGIQFRLGPGDHKPVEDFLAREHAGTAAITLDTRAARHQHDAAAAAAEAGLHLYWEPAAERLTTAGYGLEKYPLWTGDPYDTDALATDARQRQQIVDKTLEAQASGCPVLKWTCAMYRAGK